jgi:hypothetical protein
VPGLLRQDKLSEVLKRLAERPMRLHEERRVADMLGQAKEPLRQLSRRLVLGPDEIKLPLSRSRGYAVHALFSWWLGAAYHPRSIPEASQTSR